MAAPSNNLTLSTSSPSSHSAASALVDPSQPVISHSTREDVPEILAMIYELADYEHAASSVQATEETLLSTLRFAPAPGLPPTPTPNTYATTFILRAPSPHDPSTLAVAGMALYFNNYSTWRSAPGVYLEDLYVRPAFRKSGYGKLLIKALAAECKRVGGGRVEWCCLRWNENSLAFYRSLGAVEMQDWVTLRLDGEALDKMAEGAKGALVNGGEVPK
ncbi:hypothetical protein AAFC00_002336 [Neodothiora populina]|uniref:N-acetyltransferase domain-containing protein n=1 Tax=Neodothiora populina TaxID=2781224 RepID=A0ABR3PH40_9PEZI